MIRHLHWDLFTVVLFFIFGIFVTFDRSATVKDITGTVIREPFIDGGSLAYRWDGLVLRNCRGSLRRSIWQNGVIFYIPERNFSFIPRNEWNGSSHQEFTAFVSLKDIREDVINLQEMQPELQPGPAEYRVKQIAFCNMLQYWFGVPVETDFPPVHFTIHKRTRV